MHRVKHQQGGTPADMLLWNIRQEDGDDDRLVPMDALHSNERDSDIR